MVSNVVLFDIDGTLIHAKGAGKLGACRALMSAFGVEPNSGDTGFAGRTDRGIIQDLFSIHAIENSDDNWNRFQEHYMQHLPETLRETEGGILPGVVRLLGELSKLSDIAVGLLTGNTGRAANVKLDHFKIREHFGFGGFGDHHPNRNDVARLAMDAATNFVGHDLDPNQVVVIGDTPNDVTCARSIDARAIAVMTGGFSQKELSESQPDALLSDLSDTETVLKLIAI